MDTPVNCTYKNELLPEPFGRVGTEKCNTSNILDQVSEELAPVTVGGAKLAPSSGFSLEPLQQDLLVLAHPLDVDLGLPDCLLDLLVVAQVLVFSEAFQLQTFTHVVQLAASRCHRL